MAAEIRHIIEKLRRVGNDAAANALENTLDNQLRAGNLPETLAVPRALSPRTERLFSLLEQAREGAFISPEKLSQASENTKDLSLKNHFQIILKDLASQDTNSLYHLLLTSDIMNNLRQADIHTISQLEKELSNLEKFHGIGPTKADEIREQLGQHRERLASDLR